MKYRNSLRMADGGNVVTRWANKLVGNNPKAMAQRGRSEEQDAPPMPAPAAEPPKPAIRFEDGGSFGDAASMRPQAPAMGLGGMFDNAPMGAAPAPMGAAPAPTSSMTSSLRRDQILAAGARTQRYSPMMAMPGDLALADGREVPGKGEGDKVPAMLEPDEFVVSNSMMERKPGLRDALHSIRDETLVAEGKNPREVDAKQVRQATLRAMDGVDMSETWNKNIPNNGWSKEASDWRQQTRPAGPSAPAPEVASAAPRTSRIFGVGESVGNGIRSAGEATGGGLKTAGQATGSALRTGVRATGKSLVSAPNPIGALTAGFAPNAMAYVDDSVSTGDKLRLVGGGLLQAAGTAGGGVFGAGVGSVIPGPGTAAGAIAGSVAGSKGSRWLAQKVLGTDDILRKHGYDPDRDLLSMGIDAVKGKGIRDVFGGHAGVTPSDGSSWGREPRSASPGVDPGTEGANLPAPSGPTTFAAPDSGTRFQRQGTAAGSEEGVVRRVGNSFSGTNVSGYGKQNVIPAMDPGLIAETLRNPDGSKWGAADNARMAANIRDGRDPLLGTSGQVRDPIAEFAANAPKRGEFGYRQAQNDLARMRAEAVQTRGQDIQASGQASTARTASLRAQQDQANSDRAFRAGRDDAQAARGDKARDDKRQGSKAFAERITTMVGVDKDGKPDAAAASAVVNGANAFLADKLAEMDAALKVDPGNKRAAAIREDILKNGLDGIDEDTLRNLTLGQKGNQVARANDGWKINPFAGTAVQTDRPVTSLRLQKNMILPNQYVTDNEQTIPASAVEDNPDLKRLIRPSLR